jgi:hypothetical protein
MINMTQCPKYDVEGRPSCSAAICPLWKPISEQRMLPSERVCFHLLEYQKIDSEAIFNRSGRGNIYKEMGKVTEEIFASPDSYPHLIKALKKASKTGSRIKHAMNIKNSEGKNVYK